MRVLQQTCGLTKIARSGQMKTITATQAKQDFLGVIYETITNSMPIQILSEKGGVVLVSSEDWDTLQETLYLTSIPSFVEGVKMAESDKEGWVSEGEVDWGV